MIHSTCVQNLTILASAVPEINGGPKFKVGHVTLITPILGSFVVLMLGLDIAYLCTKFNHNSFSRSRDMVDAQQSLNNSRDLTTPPLQGRFVIRALALATVNLSTKFEASISTHYEDVKGNIKYRK